MTERRTCNECGRAVTPLKNGQLRQHHGTSGKPCLGGARPQPKTPDSKALRYIEEGRVTVVYVKPSDALVRVQGSRPEPYLVSFNGTWACDCEARIIRCTHVIAASLVVRVSPTARIQDESEFDAMFVRKAQNRFDELAQANVGD